MNKGWIIGLAVGGILAGGSALIPVQKDEHKNYVSIEIPAKLETMVVVAPESAYDAEPMDLGVMEVSFDANMALADAEAATDESEL